MNYRIIRHAKEGEERENHKYVARVLIEKGSSKKKNKYRYFYDKKEYQAYLKGQKEKKSEEKSNRLSEVVNNLLSGKRSTINPGTGETFLNGLFKTKDTSNNLANAVKTKTATAMTNGEKFTKSFLNQNGKTKLGGANDFTKTASKVLDFVATTVTQGIGIAFVKNLVTSAIDEKKAKEAEEAKRLKEEEDRKKQEGYDAYLEDQKRREEERKAAKEEARTAADDRRTAAIAEADATYETAKAALDQERDEAIKQLDEASKAERSDLDAQYEKARDGVTDKRELTRLADIYDRASGDLDEEYQKELTRIEEAYTAELADLDRLYQERIDKIEEAYLEETGQKVQKKPEEPEIEFPDLDRKDREYTNEEDQEAVNPNYDADAPYAAIIAYEMGDEETYWEYAAENYEFNCSYCTAAYDLRQRGYDVEAMPMNLLEDDLTTNEEILSWYEDADLVDGYEVMTVSQSQIDNMSPLKESQIEDFITDLEDNEEGSYGHLFLYWANDGGAHDVIWSVENGEVVARDCQNNTTYDPRELLMDSYYAEYFRCDDLELADEIERVVRNREDD